LVLFDVSFAGREDHGLEARLQTELAGIANWALEGLRRLNARGYFIQPAVSKEELDHIAASLNPLKDFIDEQCTFGPEGRVSCETLHDAYHAWAIANGESRILTRTPFITDFKDAIRGRGARYGTPRIGDWRGRGFTGLSVTEVESRSTTAFKPEIVKP